MKKDEGALRKAAEQAQAKVDDLRGKYQKKQDERTGRALLAAREHASTAWQELWDATPDEKPPTQRVM